MRCWLPPWTGAAREGASADPAAVFSSPFAGEGLAISPRRVEGTPILPWWSPLQPARHGRAIEVSRANFWRGRDALFPSHDAMRAHEAEGFKAAAAFLHARGVAYGWNPEDRRGDG